MTKTLATVCVVCGLVLCACTAPKKARNTLTNVTVSTAEPTTTTTTTAPAPVPSTPDTAAPVISTAAPSTTLPEPEPEPTTEPPAPPADTSSDVDIWIAMGRCEQPGDGWEGVNWSHRGPTYQGGLGFWYGTWDTYKAGTSAEGIDNAGDATPQQQMEVARNVRAAHGYHAWGCAARLGL